jgi:WD40 repeat protein
MNERSFSPLQGHTGPVGSVGWSPDGSRIVSGSDDDTVRVWNARDCKPLAALAFNHVPQGVAWRDNTALVIALDKHWVILDLGS